MSKELIDYLEASKTIIRAALNEARKTDREDVELLEQMIKSGAFVSARAMFTTSGLVQVSINVTEPNSGTDHQVLTLNLEAQHAS